MCGTAPTVTAEFTQRAANLGSFFCPAPRRRERKADFMGRAWPVLVLLALTQFCASWGSLTIIGVQVEMRAGLGISADAIAALVWSYSFGIAVGALLAQVVIGHWPRRMVLLTSMSLLGLGACGLGMAQNWEQAMVARVIMAIGGASIMPTTTVIATSIVPESQRPAALAVVFTGLTVSLILALPIASFVGTALGWRAAWFVSGGAAFVATVGLAWGVPRGVRGTRASWQAMRTIIADRATMLSIITTLLLIAGGFLTFAMISFWLVEVAGTPRWIVVPALLASGIASTAGNAISAPFLRVIGRDNTIIFGMVFTAGCFLVLWILPQAYWLALAAFVLVGLGWSLCLAPLQARLVATSGPRAQLALAINASAFFGGQGLGALAGGSVYETFGPVLMPLFSLLVLAFATALFIAAKSIPSTLLDQKHPANSA
ncbi:MAG: MFS transporter [Alphaproteobacteria bacterium TMED89]|nr:MAG: MFS transporter [Alphaproteobacteria bacterium TMED89]